jgi:NSS family neurotransmitter:Na+ symporter
MTARRETFTSRFGGVITMIGGAIGLGSVWRFPYMVGKFGGAAFVAFYVLVAFGIGVPALMAEFALGRSTRRGTVGAFHVAGLPGGRFVGYFLFGVVTVATGYYTNVIGWVVYYGLGELARPLGIAWTSPAVLPPESGFSATSFLLQLACTAAVILACVFVLLRGVRAGIEKASKIIVPVLLFSLITFVARALTLPGNAEGLRWYILKFDLAALDAKVMVAALGQAMFSLSLGGTFMVAYGSYLRDDDRLGSNAVWTTAADTAVGLIAGLAIFPAIFALKLDPTSGPRLLFETLPGVFAGIPLGWLFGLLFFAGLAGAGYLSDISAFEVLVAGVTDNTTIGRKRAVWIMAGAVFLLSIPPMINMKVFLPWDLTFGSGMQTLGALIAVLTVGWALNRSEALRQLAAKDASAAPPWLYWWIRLVVPGAILAVGGYWLATEVLGLVSGV